MNRRMIARELLKIAKRLVASEDEDSKPVIRYFEQIFPLYSKKTGKHTRDYKYLVFSDDEYDERLYEDEPSLWEQAMQIIENHTVCDNFDAPPEGSAGAEGVESIDIESIRNELNELGIAFEEGSLSTGSDYYDIDFDSDDETWDPNYGK